MADVAELGIIVELKNGQLVARHLDEIDKSARKVEESGKNVERMAEGLNKTLEVLGLTLGALEMIRLANEARELGERYEAAELIALQLARVHGVLAEDIDKAEESMRAVGVTAFQSRENVVALLRANIDLSNASKLAAAAQDLSVISSETEAEAMHQLTIAVQTGMDRTLKRAGIEADMAKAVAKTAAAMGVNVDQLSRHSLEQIRLNALLTAAGRIQGTYTAALKTSYGEMIVARKAIQNIGLAVGLAFAESSRSIITGFADALKGIGEAANKKPRLLHEIAAAIIAMTAAITSFLVVWFTFTAAMKVWAATETIRVFVELATAIRNTADAMALLAIVAEAVKKNWLAIAAGIAAITAGYMAFRKLVKDNPAEVVTPPTGGSGGGNDDSLSSSEEALKRLAQMRKEIPGFVRDLRSVASAFAGTSTMSGEYAERQAKLNDEIRKGTDGLVDDAKAEAEKLIRMKETAEFNVVAAKRYRDVSFAIQDQDKANALAEIQARSMGIEVGRNAIQFEYLQKKVEASRLEMAGFTDAAAALRESAERTRESQLHVLDVTRTLAPIKTFLETIDEGLHTFIEDLSTRPREAWKNMLDTMRSMFASFVADIVKISAEKSLIPKLAGMLGMVGVNGNSPNPTLGVAGATAGIASFGVGYGMGSLTTHRDAGAIMGLGSGAAMGAMIGSVVPVLGTAIGAAVGGLAGLAGGLLGTASAAKEAREQERMLREQYAVNVAQIKLTLGILSPLDAALAENKKQFSDLTSTIEKEQPKWLQMNGERNSKLAETAHLEELRKQQLIEENAYLSEVRDQELSVRLLRVAGHTEEATLMDLAIQQEKEYRDAKSAGASAAQLAALKTVQLAEKQQLEADLLEAQRRGVEDLNQRLALALGVSQDVYDDMAFRIQQEREYKDAVRAGKDEVYLATLKQTLYAESVARSITKVQNSISGLDATISGIKTFQNSLKLDNTNSPTDRLAEALRQYNETVALAKTGNADAAGRLPQVSQIYLDALRQVDASSPAYQAGRDRVNHDLDDVVKVFETQRSILQQQLDELIRIRDEIHLTRLRDQLDGPLHSTTGSGADATAANLTAIVDKTTENTAVLRAGFLTLAQKIEDTNDRLDTLANVHAQGNEAIAAALT